MNKYDDELFEKEMNQLDKVDETVDVTLASMGAIWKACGKKFLKDSVCHICKKPISKEEKFDIVIVPEHKVDKGLFAVVSVCKECNSQEDSEVNKNE